MHRVDRACEAALQWPHVFCQQVVQRRFVAAGVAAPRKVEQVGLWQYTLSFVPNSSVFLSNCF